MHYELRRLESMLKQKGNNDQEALVLEQERIEHALLEVLYSDKPKEKIVTYVQQHAKILLELLKDSAIRSDTRKKADLTLQQVCSQLLLFLEKHGDLYWDYELPAPPFRQEPILNAARAVFELTRERIVLMPANTLLVKHVENDLQALLYNEQTLCYGQLYLLRDITTTLSTLSFSSEDRKENSCLLIEVLCRYNFNSRNLFYWGVQEIQERETALPQEADSIFMLRRLQFFFKRIRLEPGYCYRPHRPVLSLLLSEYINDRLDLKKRESPPVALQAATSVMAGEDQQIHTSVSEELLCFLFRLFLDLNIFRSTNRRALARFLGARFITVRQKNKDNMDISGIYTFLYSPRLPAVMRTEELLHQMLKRLQEWKVALKNTGKPPKEAANEK